jgi:hypothetical protein
MPEFTPGPEFDTLANGLDKADSLFTPFASRAAAVTIEAIKEIIQPYAPQPSRTRAKTFNTYVRGRGQYPKSSFMEARGAPGGFKVKRTSKAKIRFTSQQMDKRFRTEVTARAGGVDADLYNDATYSGYVLGHHDDEPKQMDYHAKSGWVSQDDAVDQAGPVADQALQEAISDFLQAL